MTQMMWASLLAGLATGVGALLALLFGKPSAKVLSVMLGFASGIMLAISAFDLMPEAVELSSTSYTVFGFLLGALLMYALDRAIPHMHLGSGEVEGPESLGADNENLEMLKLGYFIFFGIALHNIPEGLALGAGFVSNYGLGIAIAVSLALHNVPEGMATAVPLLRGGMGKLKVLGLTTLAGLMTPVGTLLGAVLFNVSELFIGLALAFAAGAMVYIVSDELIPQSHKYHSHWANFGLLIGFIVGFLL